MGEVKAFYTHGTDSNVYYVIYILLYVAIIIRTWIRFPQRYYLLKYLVYGIYCMRILDLTLNKFKFSIVGVVICSSAIFITFVLFLLIAIRPWRNMYVRTATILSDEMYIINPVPTHTDTELTVPNASVSVTTGVGLTTLPKKGTELAGRLGEAYKRRLRRYVVWQYTEFAIWASSIVILSIIIMWVTKDFETPAFYVYGSLISVAYVTIAFRAMYYYGTLLGSLTKDMKQPLDRIGLLLLLQVALLILPMFNTYFYDMVGTIIMALYYFAEVVTVYVTCSAFSKGMEFHSKLFSQELNQPSTAL